ncbi:MAG: nuclear transport factor 2 family protein [Candidatus Thorarchaeota archaeon]
MSVSENIQVVIHANDAFNTIGAEGFAEFLNEDVIDYFPFDRKPLIGKKSIVEDNIAFRKMFKDLRVEIVNIFGQDDWVCFQAYVIGTNPGESGIRVPICNVVRLKDGKISEVHEYFDQTTFTAQMQPNH